MWSLRVKLHRRAGRCARRFNGDVPGTLHGFLFDKGNFTTIDVPGATTTAASGINGFRQIVGLFTDAGGTFHGFLALP